MAIILFVCLLALTVVHFVYERLLLPTIRLNLRYQVFALRDQLRGLHDESLDPKVYRYMQEALNNSINILPRLNLSLIWEAQRALRDNPGLEKRIETRWKVINECPVEEICTIYRDCGAILMRAFNANCFFFYIYLLPFVLIGLFFFECKNKIVRFIEYMLSVPEKESPIIPSLRFAE